MPFHPDIGLDEDAGRAARTIAQVSRAVAPGGIEPEQVITPGIFVQGIVEVADPQQEEMLNRADAHYPEVQA